MFNGELFHFLPWRLLASKLALRLQEALDRTHLKLKVVDYDLIEFWKVIGSQAH